jgi:S-methylmethionine-dependent homocysteine/selenocysteine methylase
VLTILNGPTGTELIRRGFALDGEAWSAAAVEQAPELLASIHADYALAGATVHTACTFRTQPRLFPDRFAELTRRAVDLCRRAVPSGHLVAGSLAPVMDCYEPAAAPRDREARAAHERMAHALADAGADLILCETFPSTREALIACDAALTTGKPVWLSLTGGPEANLMSPAELAFAGRAAADRGAAAVLVNCVSASVCFDYVLGLAQALGATGRDGGARVGVFANAGPAHDALGWADHGPEAVTRYANLARLWVQAGASIVGSCCGTGPAHTRELARRLLGRD